MASKTDIVALKWVVGLMNKQAENAEASLVDYSNDPSNKRPLLQCMWAVHQITSTLRALGMRKGEMLTLEMERSLNYLYKDKVTGERRKLTMGGLMQALKVLPAYFAHAQNARADSGQGLEQHVNDMRRWLGERPRPPAYFFHMEIPENAGISVGGQPAADEEIRERANVMLALYLEMAKMALRRKNVKESMKTVARISRRMQTLFVGTEPERFWLTMIGICEGVAGGLIVPDECIAQIFKTGAFTIKYARENGAAIDPNMDYQATLQQMLYYIAACKARPVHIGRIRGIFGISENTLSDANGNLIHADALVTALSSALDQLNTVVDHLNTHDLAEEAKRGDGRELDNTALVGIEATQYRLEAAGQMVHADSLHGVQGRLEKLYRGDFNESPEQLTQAISDIIRGIVDVKLDIEHKLEHGLGSSFSSREFELRESVVAATFNHMGLVENYMHQILRRKELASALARKPKDDEALLRLTVALNRHLNKTDQGYEELREAVRQADAGEADVDRLLELSRVFLNEQETLPDRKAIDLSLELLDEIAGALGFAGMEEEASIIDRCSGWLRAASKAGEVREDDAFRCFAEAFAQLELHLQRSVIDPLDDTEHMLAIARQRAAELDEFAAKLSSGAEVVEGSWAEPKNYVEDADIPPEFREVFIEESEEIVAEISTLTPRWLETPDDQDVLRDIRRHFHTFKGNGRAVGANILGELGWAVQDMLDRVLDGDLEVGESLKLLMDEVVNELPVLVASYKDGTSFDVTRTRELTDRCFRMASGAGEDLAGTLPQIDDQASASASDSSVVEPLGH
ncbi:Hpt domain-containing protein [Halioglobus sp. HI00S01]|uniref:Hpt domain-containing protein n=1 Tax=Halioglobus sp. HI00S01 TaxID=1822214 RepID=UPI0012E85ABD|nr:Hpt domain-containing protein [Halioglobus sp. HI00S01]